MAELLKSDSPSLYPNPYYTSASGTRKQASEWFRDVESSRVLASSAVAIPLTGSTTETTLATVTVPGGAMGPNGIIRLTTHWSYTNSANNKILRAKFGGSSFLVFTATTTAQFRDMRQIQNRGATNSQAGFSTGGAGGFGAVGGTVATFSVDTTVPQDIILTGQLALGTETITLESYLIELIAG